MPHEEYEMVERSRENKKNVKENSFERAVLGEASCTSQSKC